MDKIQVRLDKLEGEIMAKKQREFHCDEVDKEKGQILTFARKYEQLRENLGNKGPQPLVRQAAASSMVPENSQETPGEVVESEASESDVSNHSETEGVKSQILKEFNLLAQGRVKVQRGRGAGGFRAREKGGGGE
ncbi:hypothetical protein NDU88_001887 [Pleurodeles waltl]|uniref:Uncharacterized protein n=1 Tax=Pleurodeles waltl TaxID=8319 RepID=A0AAV7U7P3_PLEWA|nr:hypothetical protein NDU88_001887 [Pleurodeles waltl]